jgi:hypothetical protein
MPSALAALMMRVEKKSTHQQDAMTGHRDYSDKMTVYAQ